jgi:DnaJ-domain-containing protein 1
MAITPGQVSRFLRDFAENNVLLDEVEFEEEDIRDAMKFAVDEYNAITPVTVVDENSFPNDWVLLLGTCAHLMMSEAFLQIRNQVSYQDGDIQVSMDNKAEFYSALSDKIKSEWKSVAQKIKQQQNMETMYDSLSSGYRYIYTGFRNR